MNLLDYCKGYPKHTFDPDEIILQEGNQTGLLYVLVDGTVEIKKQGVVLNRVSEPGAIFGEISALLNTPHMATVKAINASRLYVIEDANKFIRSQPDVGVLLARIMAQRLSSVTGHLTNVTHTLNNLMKRETTPKKAEEETPLPKPVVRVFRVAAVQRGNTMTVS